MNIFSATDPTPAPDARCPMMAFNRTPEAPVLDAASVAELRDALARSVSSGSHDESLKDVLTRVATDARRKGMLAEHLLLALKDIWYGLPEVSGHSGDETRTRLLQQLIARCIQEYYTR